MNGLNTHAARDHYFSNQRLINNALMMLALLLLNRLGTPGNVLCFAILTVMALRSATAALMALSMTALLIIASEVLVDRGPLFSMLKFWILFVAGTTLIRESRRPLGQPEQIALLVFAAVAAVLSVVNNYYVEISLLKNAMFSWGVLCLLSVSGLDKDLGPILTEWMLSMILLVIALSYILYAGGSAGGEFDSVWGERFRGFRGATSHPQTMGVMASLFAVYLTALYLFTVIHRKTLLLAGIGLLLILVYLSQARTGMLGYFLATSMLLFTSSLGQQRVSEARTYARYRQRFFQMIVLGVFLGSLFELGTGRLTERFDAFLIKDADRQTTLAGAFQSSRSRQIEDAWRTFLKNPVTGIGFGTDDTPSWRRTASIFSASAEKGFLPTAILEETGFVGTTFFVLFLLVLLGQLILSRQFVGLAILLAILVFNFAEMMFFALGGMGMMCWVLFAAALSAGKQSVLSPAHQESRTAGAEDTASTISDPEPIHS